MSGHDGYIPIEDGLHLHYQTLGDGGPVLMIPEACSLMEDLRPLAEQYRLIFYDPRGRGRSDRDPAAGHNRETVPGRRLASWGPETRIIKS